MVTADAAPEQQENRAAVEKACALLSVFCNSGDTVMGVSELARRTGLTKSTAHRQLGMLERADMVERSGQGYRIGPGLRTLAREVSDAEQTRLSDALLPFLVELFEVTRHAVQLAVLEGREAVYVGKVYGHRTIILPSRAGARLPAHCTSGGKLLLAYEPAAATEVLDSPLRRLTSNTVSSPAQLARELAEIRRRGIAFDAGETNVGISCVASLVTAIDGKPVAAISLCAPRDTNLAALGDVLRRIASAASKRIGLVAR